MHILKQRSDILPVVHVEIVNDLLSCLSDDLINLMPLLYGIADDLQSVLDSVGHTERLGRSITVQWGYF
ncbi:hypothetical protein HRbin08_00054 [bacterium HR08]|nr:hypothetical protein HRbin08_00054 [bacterium HR08]